MNDDKKFFTIEEAEKMIPWLTRALKKVLDRKTAIEYLVAEHQEFAKMIEVTSDEGFQFVLSNNVNASRVFLVAFFITFPP